jgi:hypothetical protein
MFLALLACLLAGLGADETDGVAEPEVGAFAAGPTPPTSPDDTSGSPTTGGAPLTVTVHGAAVAVVHTFDEDCGAVFRGASAIADEGVVTVTYDFDDRDEVVCDWWITYTLTGLTAGDWTLRAREDAVDFTVEP